MLFPSTLVISDQISSIDKLLLELNHKSIQNNPDIFLVSEYTVENIRSINNFLSRKPYSHDSKIVIIPSCHLLNIESQNTLLKNLEEPGSNNYFILQTDKPNSLISTIISRCQIINLSIPTPSTSSLLTIPKTISDSLTLSETLPKDKPNFIAYIDIQIRIFQRELINHPTVKNSKILELLIKVSTMTSANIDPKFLADYLMLSISVIPA